jgi:hypothetical protein
MTAAFAAGEDLTAARLNATVGAYQVRMKDATETVNNSTAFQDDNHFSFPVVAGGKYLAELHVGYQSSAVANLKCRWVLPSGNLDCNMFQLDAGTSDLQIYAATDGQIVGIPGTGVSVPLPLILTHAVFIGGTGGNLKWQWAQNVAEVSNTSILIGSYCTLSRVA